MKTRPADPEDMNEIYMHGYDVWSEGMSKQAYLSACKQSKKYRTGKWFVLEVDKKIVSSLILYDLDHGWKGMGSISTLPEYRGNGYAAKLIRDTLSQADHTDVYFIYSDILPEYYEQFGFTPLPDEYQTDPRSCCMIKATDPEKIWNNHSFLPPAYF